MTAYESSIWMEDSEGVLQRTDHYELRPCRVRGNDRRLPFILLSACCLLAACGVFWVAGVAALYVGYWVGAAGFVLFWSLVTAGIWCVGETSKDGSES